jgi:hypothetical protein
MNHFKRLFTYKNTHDSGFAPNPFYDVLTLATCKPGIRRTKKVGDWIAGFTSNFLVKLAKKRGIVIENDALIYLGRISEVLPLKNYYADSRFKNKIPPTERNSNKIKCAGDNIYKYETEEKSFMQISQIHHNENDIERDLSGKNVLICNKFYYLGKKAIHVPNNIIINRPKTQTAYGYKTENSKEIEQFVKWIKNNFDEGINALP